MSVRLHSFDTSVSNVRLTKSQWDNLIEQKRLCKRQLTHAHTSHTRTRNNHYNRFLWDRLGWCTRWDTNLVCNQIKKRMFSPHFSIILRLYPCIVRVYFILFFIFILVFCVMISVIDMWKAYVHISSHPIHFEDQRAKKEKCTFQCGKGLCDLLSVAKRWGMYNQVTKQHWRCKRHTASENIYISFN